MIRPRGPVPWRPETSRSLLTARFFARGDIPAASRPGCAGTGCATTTFPFVLTVPGALAATSDGLVVPVGAAADCTPGAFVAPAGRKLSTFSPGSPMAAILVKTGT